MSSSNCIDEVVADDFRPDLSFYGLDCSVSDEVSDHDFSGVPRGFYSLTQPIEVVEVARVLLE